MKYWLIVILFCCIPVSVFADQQVLIQWLAGNCHDSFRVYRSTITGWVRIAEVVEPELEIIVPNRIVLWRVSGICKSGVNKGEWWMNRGVWTGKNVAISTKP